MSATSPLAPGKLPPALLTRLLDQNRVTDGSVVVGPGLGRDAAVVRPSDELLVVKSDPITFPTDRPARYLIQVNANDIACMGATPRWLLVTALFPEGHTTEQEVEATFLELQAVSAAAGVSLVGGHTEVTIGLDRLILIGCMLGEVQRSALLDPSAAKPGDRILLTRSAGIEGTALLASELAEELNDRIGPSTVNAAARFIDEPGLSVVSEARLLADAGVVSTLHDPTEGGVAMAIRELAAAAGAGAIVSEERIPVAAETRAVCDALGLDPLGLLASGALLGAVPPEQVEQAEAVLSRAGVRFSWIGKLTPEGAGCQMRTAEGVRDLPVFVADEVARALSTVGRSGRNP